MQVHPSNWDLLLQQPHITQYRFTINDEVKTGDYIQGVPVIEKPMMLEPVIGRCCTGSLTITVRKADNEQIPKASPVEVDCRLASYDETTVSEWIPQGRYFVTKRQGFGELVSLTCRDSMINAGKTYRDKATIASWPASMADVLDDIADLMDVEIDSRTEINTGEGYTLSQPEEDVLMSEVLCQIAAVHGGNFIITEAGKLRLVPFPITSDPVFSLNQSYKTYTPYSDGENTISRIIMKNSAGQQYTVGDDTGVWIQGECETVSQALTDKLAGGAYRFENGTFYFPSGSFVNETAVITDTALEVTTAGTVRTLVNGLLGRHYVPYRLDGAYIDPCMELGDTFTVLYRGRTLQLIANTITVNCTTGYTCHVENGVMYDDEEEVVYVTPQEKQQERTSARSVRNATRISGEIDRATEAETGLSTRITRTDEAITLEAQYRTSEDDRLAGLISVEHNKVAMVVKEEQGGYVIKAAEIATEINKAGSNAYINADHVYITGTSLLSGQVTVQDGRFQVLTILGVGSGNNLVTINNGKISALNYDVKQGGSLKFIDNSSGETNNYTLNHSTVAGMISSASLTNGVLTLNRFGNTPLSISGGVRTASVSGNILTITLANGDTVPFSKATSLNGGWSSGTYTVIAEQTNINTTTGLPETTEVNRDATELYGVIVNGTITKQSTPKRLNVPVEVLYTDSSEESGYQSTGFTEVIGVDASLIYDDGWDAAANVASQPSSISAGTVSATLSAAWPYTRTVGNTKTRGTDSKQYTLHSTKNDAYITIFGDNDQYTDYAHIVHNQFNNGWTAAYSKVSLPDTNTSSASMAVNTPKSTEDNTPDETVYTVSVDASYAYIKTGTGANEKIVAQVENSYVSPSIVPKVSKGLWVQGSITFTAGVTGEDEITVTLTWNNGSWTWTAGDGDSGSYQKQIQVKDGTSVALTDYIELPDTKVVVTSPGNQQSSWWKTSGTNANKYVVPASTAKNYLSTDSGNEHYLASGTGEQVVINPTEAVTLGQKSVTPEVAFAGWAWTQSGSSWMIDNFAVAVNPYDTSKTFSAGVGLPTITPHYTSTGGKIQALIKDSNNLERVYTEKTFAITLDTATLPSGTSKTDLLADTVYAINIKEGSGTKSAIAYFKTPAQTAVTPLVSKGNWNGGQIVFTANTSSGDSTASVDLDVDVSAVLDSSNNKTNQALITVKDGNTSTGETKSLHLTQGTWDTSTNKKIVQLRAGSSSGTVIAESEVDASGRYQAGQQSVTVTGASIEANSVTYTGRIGRTARGNMLVRLSNMDEEDDPIRLTGIQLDAVYQSGLDGGSDYTSTADFEFVLTDGDDSWLGYYEDIPVSEIYQQGRRDAAPAVNRTYIYNSSGEKVHVYKSLDYMSGGYLGWIYPNTPVSKATTKYSRYYKITYQGISGYVWESALIDSTSTTPSPSLYTDIGWVPEYPYTSYVFAATGSTVWIRKSASTSASTVCAVPVGDSISCKENPNGYSGTWMEVKYGDKTGYMMAQYIAGTNEYYSHQGGSGMDETYRWATRVLSVSSSSVPLYSSSSTSSSVVTSVPHNSVIYCADEYRTAGVEWVRVKYGTSTGYMEAKYIRGTDACDQEQQEAAEQLDIYVSGVYYTGSKTGVVNFANVWVYYTYTNSGFDSFVLKGSKSACNATDTRYNANSQMIRQIESDDERLSGETVHVVFNDGSEVEKTVVYAV